MANTTQQSGANIWNSLPLLAGAREIMIRLTKDEKAFIATQAQTLLSEYYAHLPQKVSAYGINPIQAARVLCDLAKVTSDVPTSGYNPDLFFFRKVMDLFNSLHDRHSYFTLPEPWASMIAVLPFTLEACFEDGRRKTLLTKLVSDLGDPDLIPGVEVTHWNGMPIDNFIGNLAVSNNGAYFEAQRALAFANLTMRPLSYCYYPDEDWVTLTYIAPQRNYKSVSVPWRIYIPQPQSAAGVASAQQAPSSGTAHMQGVDKATLIVKGAVKDIFAGIGATQAGENLQMAAAANNEPTFLIPQPAGTPNPLAGNLTFQPVQTPSGLFGYLRIFSFENQDPDNFILSCVNILKSLPQNGLIIDVRSNPGGTIPCGEGLAQLLTHTPIESLPVAFKNSDSVRRVIDGGKETFAQWKPSADILIRTGQQYSQGFGLTPVEVVRQIGYTYPGKVVLIIDGLCYSTTDFFAGVFQDFGIGTIIGVDGYTGGGGANVWTYDILSYYIQQAEGKPLPPLPRGVGMSISMRHALRRGPSIGIPLEGMGVKADIRYNLTRKDVLSKNEDMLAFAGQVLSQMK